MDHLIFYTVQYMNGMPDAFICTVTADLFTVNIRLKPTLAIQ